MDDSILDDFEPEEIEGLPRELKYLLARVVFLIYLIYTLVFRIYSLWSYYIEVESFLISIFVLRILLDVFLVYYLGVHALMEQKKELSKPKFPKNIVKFALFLTALMLFTLVINLLRVHGNFGFGFSINLIFRIITMLALIAIFIREMAYLQWLKKANKD